MSAKNQSKRSNNEGGEWLAGHTGMRRLGVSRTYVTLLLQKKRRASPAIVDKLCQLGLGYLYKPADSALEVGQQTFNLLAKRIE